MLRAIVILYALLLNSLIAETLHLESGVKKNSLIELYTSEGCSSCPPAEEYLNSFKNNKGLWETWVPVAFHVDYWDYIGWKDRYASKSFSQRQRQYARLKRATTVYTPAFMVNGTSWRPDIFSRSPSEETSNAGNLIVNIEGKSLAANFNPVNKLGNKLKLNVAVLGMGLSTYIKRGENTGRTAEHEFVVVGYSLKESENNQWEMSLPELHYSDVKNFALAVWVSQDNDPTPIQSLGTLLPLYN